MTERTRDLNKGRPKRVPLHEQKRDILTAPQREGFVRRIVNDVGNRIERFQKAGWQVVEDPDIFIGEGVNNNQTLGTGARKGVGGGITGVLMELPKEIYDEDQAAKQRELDEKEREMRRSLNSGAGGTYGSVDITSTK
jgi:hypothetical protein